MHVVITIVIIVNIKMKKIIDMVTCITCDIFPSIAVINSIFNNSRKNQSIDRWTYNDQQQQQRQSSGSEINNMKLLLVVDFAVFVVVEEGTIEYTALTSLTLYVIKFIVYSSLSIW